MSDQCFSSQQERLRYLAQVAKGKVMAGALTNAADAIEALQAEVLSWKTEAEIRYKQVNELQARVKELVMDTDILSGTLLRAVAAEDEIKRLNARVEELENELRKVRGEL